MASTLKSQMSQFDADESIGCRMRRIDTYRYLGALVRFRIDCNLLKPVGVSIFMSEMRIAWSHKLVNIVNPNE